ncbi:MAG: IS3 family transposase [Acholeplasmataceae bacterium]|nr:IS3 family transposase [Acholeplasmataceae bacterium]
MANTKIKKQVIRDFKNGLSTNDLISKYGFSKSTINEWVRPVRLNIEHLNYKKLTSKYSKLLKNHEETKLELEIYKNLNCLPSSSRLDKMNAIEKFYKIYPARTMCRVLDVNVGTFYNHMNRRVKVHENEKIDNKLRPLVLEVFNKSEKRFGARRIAQILRKDGHVVSEKRVSSLMKELNIKPYLAKRRRVKKKYEANNSVYLENLVKGNFKRDNPNEVWVGDITQITIKENFYYICVIIDLFSRKIISHVVSYRNSENLVCNTLNKAFEARGDPKDLTFHSDRGPQYTSFKYKELLKSLEIKRSFSQTARPRDNAVVESFFSYLKREETNRYDYENMKEFKISVAKYIDFYNDYRPHSYLNGMTPNEFEENYYKKNGLLT